MTDAVQFDKVTKRYGSHTALDEFTLSIPKGSIFALVGRNDAGKTTAVKILLGLVRATSGTVTVFDGNPSARIGYLPEILAQYEWMTGHDYLQMSAGLVNTPKAQTAELVDRLLAEAKLGDGQTRIRDYSRVQRVCLGLAHALIGAPDLLILDEPTSDLDAVGHHEVLDMIDAIGDRFTILMCTHLLADAVHVAKKIGIIENGRLITTGTRQELWQHANLPRQIEIKVTGNHSAMVFRLQDEPWVESVSMLNDSIQVSTRDYNRAWERIPVIVQENDTRLKHLELLEPSFDDVFIRLVGGES